MPKFIVIYREHNLLNIDTCFVGPFDTYGEAYDALCEMPSLGHQYEDGAEGLPGVKYIEELHTTLPAATQSRAHIDDEYVETKNVLYPNLVW
jgi:hypothetical protein